MAYNTAVALAKLEESVGDVDEYVREALGYPTKEDLFASMGAEQIDALALHLRQAETDGMVIEGDETGIGKGRVAAGAMEWAKQRGYIPIFFTAKPKLFTDMYRDIVDIGRSVNPLIISHPKEGIVLDKDGNPVFSPIPVSGRESAFRKILEEGWKASGYDAIFIPYSQIQQKNIQQKFLQSLANNNDVVIVLDESHEAAGDTSMRGVFMRGGEISQGSGPDKVTYNYPGLIFSPGVKSVFALSATWAKRPENIAVYLKTKLGLAAENREDLIEALKRGGVALQQAVADALAADGQMIRRERNFAGTSYERRIIAEDSADLIQQRFDAVAAVMREIRDISYAAREAIKDGALEGRLTALTDAQTNYTTFASTAHNLVSQLLFASKVEYVAAEAIETFRKGEKPIITFVNTMEGAIKRYAEENELKSGSPIAMRWNELLAHALNRTFRISIKNPGGKPYTEAFSPDAVGLKAPYDRIMKMISELQIDLPVSPIDALIYHLESAGIKVGEITGRESGIKYTSSDFSTGIFQIRPKPDANLVVGAFQNGGLDACLINASGSTGISMHASEVFKERPIKPRRMITAQAHADINVHVQTLGRIRRTGMIEGGASYLDPSLPLAAEIRPALLRERKMKALNANTTGKTTGLGSSESVDFMNKYGDDVIMTYLYEVEPDLQDELGIEVRADSKGKLSSDQKDLTMFFTGKLALLPNARQQEILEAITEAYVQYVEYLKAADEYDLEMAIYEDWDGVMLSDEVLVPGEDEGSIFTASTRLQKWEVKDSRHVPKAAEMKQEHAARYGEDGRGMGESIDEFSEQMESRFGEAIQRAQERRTEASEAERKLIDKRITSLGAMRANFRSNIMRYLKNLARVGNGYVEVTNTETGEVDLGMITSIQFPKQSGNGIRTGPSAFTIGMLLNKPGGRIRVPLNRVMDGSVHIRNAFIQADDEAQIDTHAAGARYERWFITGNPIRAIVAAGNRGRLASFAARDGSKVSGILLPMQWGPTELAKDPRTDLVNEAAASRFLETSRGGIHSGDVEVTERYRGGYQVRVPAARSRGGKVYLDKDLRRVTGDFDKSGSKMIANLDRSELQPALKRIREITGRPFRPIGQATESDLDRIKDINAAALGQEPTSTTVEEAAERYMAREDMPADHRVHLREAARRAAETAPEPYQTEMDFDTAAAEREWLFKNPFRLSPEQVLRAFGKSDSVSSIITSELRQPSSLNIKNLIGKTIHTAKDWAILQMPLRSHVESHKVAYLDKDGNVLFAFIHSIGGPSSAVIPDNTVLTYMPEGTVAVVSGHNHPSGRTYPSQQDVATAKRLAEICELAGVKYLDHIITDGDNYTSMRDWSIGHGERQLEVLGGLKDAPKNVDPYTGRETPLGEYFSAPWETMPMSEIARLDNSEGMTSLFGLLRQANPNHKHIVYLNTNFRILGIERFELDYSGMRADQNAVLFAQKAYVGASRLAATQIMADFGILKEHQDKINMYGVLGTILGRHGVDLVDAGDSTVTSYARYGIADTAMTGAAMGTLIREQPTLPGFDEKLTQTEWVERRATEIERDHADFGLSIDRKTAVRRAADEWNKLHAGSKKAVDVEFTTPKQHSLGLGPIAEKGQSLLFERSEGYQLPEEGTSRENIPLKNGKPDFPDIFPTEESKARWKAAYGIDSDTFSRRLRERLKDLRHSAVRQFRDLPDQAIKEIDGQETTVDFRPAIESLTLHQYDFEIAQRKAIEMLERATRGLSREDAGLFNLVPIKDLAYEARRRTIEDMPFGLTRDQVLEMEEKFDALVEGNPAVQKAIEIRRRMRAAVAQELVEVGILKEGQVFELDDDGNRVEMRNEDYYHHQVLQYANFINKFSPGRKGKKPTPGYAKGRKLKSTKDYNTDLTAADALALTRAFYDIRRARRFKELVNQYDVSPILKVRARAMNDQAMISYFEKLARAEGMQKKDGSPVTGEELYRDILNKKMAIGYSKLMKLAGTEEGLPYNEKWSELVYAMGEAQAEGMDLDEDYRALVIPYAAWVMKNYRDTEAGIAAATIFKGLSEKRQYIQKTLGELEQFTRWQDLVPAGYEVHHFDPRRVFFQAQSIPANVMDRLIDDNPYLGKHIKGMVRNVLAMGGWRDSFVVPEELVKTFETLSQPHNDGALKAAAVAMTTAWKKWILINPRRVFRYNWQNQIGDLDGVIAGAPGVLKPPNLVDALRQLGRFYQGGEVEGWVTEAYERGVLSSTLTFEEIPSLEKLKVFEKKINVGKLNVLQRYLRQASKWTTFRENFLRLAAYKYFHDRFSQGDYSNIGAANRTYLMAQDGPSARAAVASRQLLGDYGAITEMGNEIRRVAIPFYSWLEINAKRYARLMHNSFTEPALSLSQKAGRTARIGGTGAAKIGLKAFGYWMRMIILTGLFEIWNQLFNGDDEARLNDYDRRRVHLNISNIAHALGFPKERSYIIRGQTALGDIFEWFGLNDIVSSWDDIRRGIIGKEEVVGMVAKAPANKVVQGINPYIKWGIEGATGIRMFPDITEQSYSRLPPGQRFASGAAQMFSMIDEYKLLSRFIPGMNPIPSRPYWDSWSQAFITSKNREELAYSNIMSRKYEYLEQQGRGGRVIGQSEKALAAYNYRKAVAMRDVEAAAFYKNKIREMKGDPRDTLKYSDPLWGLSRERGPGSRSDFIYNYLDPQDREQLKEAEKYYRASFHGFR